MVMIGDEKAVPGMSAGTTLVTQKVMQPSSKGREVDPLAEIFIEARLK
jgi:hypothetical protein